MNMEEIIMGIIINAGDARAYAHEALEKANSGDFQGASSSIELADEAIGRAHDSQTSLLHKEAQGEKIEITALFVHSQDHLMTAITEKNLILQIIELRRQMQPLLDQAAKA
ncbi:PTS lactose/cellobiose transporter subunit IIA [Clostridium yunnanense]